MEGSRVKNKIIKQGIPKIHINRISPSSTLSFCCYTHNDTSDIFSENPVLYRFQSYSSKKEGVILRYINNVKAIHSIGPPTTCGYQYCGEKQICVIILHGNFTIYLFAYTGRVTSIDYKE